jgi:hypothetical protein
MLEELPDGLLMALPGEPAAELPGAAGSLDAFWPCAPRARHAAQKTMIRSNSFFIMSLSLLLFCFLVLMNVPVKNDTTGTRLQNQWFNLRLASSAAYGECTCFFWQPL